MEDPPAGGWPPLVGQGQRCRRAQVPEAAQNLQTTALIRPAPGLLAVTPKRPALPAILGRERGSLQASVFQGSERGVGFQRNRRPCFKLRRWTERARMAFRVSFGSCLALACSWPRTGGRRVWRFTSGAGASRVMALGNTGPELYGGLKRASCASDSSCVFMQALANETASSRNGALIRDPALRYSRCKLFRASFVS